MVYVKWSFFLVVNILTNYLINWPLAPIVVLFAEGDGWLPDWLWYFQTPDNPLDGDAGWKNNKPYPKEYNAYQRWVNRFSWLHRNKLYGFGAAVLGIEYDRVNHVYERLGDLEVRNVPSPGKSGTVRRWLYDEHGRLIAWQFYYIRQWKRWPNKCIRLNAGWKLWSWEDRKSESASFVFSPSPWMTFEP